MTKVETKEIRKGLYFVSQEVEVPKTIKDSEQTIQYWIFDRSGSRYGSINDDIQVAKEFVGTLSEGSEVVLAWFSSQGQYGLSQPFTLKKQLGAVVISLDSMSSTLGCTCFNEVLEEVYSYHTKNHSNKKGAMLFFTDGEVNDGKPIQATIDILKKWKEVSNVNIFAGYGWLNRVTMTRMAEACDGSFIQLQNNKGLKSLLEQFVLSVDDVNPKIKVDLECPSELAISISGNNIFEYKPENLKIEYSPSKKNKTCVYYLTNSKHKNCKEITSFEEHQQKGLRSLALIYSQKNKSNIALEILASSRDKFLVDKMDSAISPDEFGKVEELIKESIFDKSQRFRKGECAEGYLPAEDAYSILDFMTDLANEENAKLHLKDDRFEYNRIGAGSKQIDGSKFEQTSDVVGINDVVFNQTRLNLSINTYCNGVVPLNPKEFSTGFTKADLKKHSLGDSYLVVSFRTYTIVADGKYSTWTLVLSGLSKELVDKLQKAEVIKEQDKNGVIVIDVSSLPMGNKKLLSKSGISAKKLAKLNLEQYELKTEQSVIKSMIKVLKAEPEDETETINQGLKEQKDFLEKFCYIKNGSYSPPVKVYGIDKTVDSYSDNKLFLSDTKELRVGMNVYGLGKEVEITKIDTKNRSVEVDTDLSKMKLVPTELTFKMNDFYEAYSFDIKLDGMSDVSMSAYKKAKDKTSDRMKLFHENVLKYEKETKLEKLEKRLKEVKDQLSVIRKELQIAKFLIVMVNKGSMAEFESRENMQLVENGKITHFEIKEIKVKI